MNSIRGTIIREEPTESAPADLSRKRCRRSDASASRFFVSAPTPRAPTLPPRQPTPPPPEPRDTERAPSGSRRSVGSLERSRSEERAECNIISPHRKNRRRFYIEAAMAKRSILSSGFSVRGVEFRVYPELRDNDTLKTPGVASRLGWSTVLPRDEHSLFKNFSEGEDLADQEFMRATQRIIINNAQHRAYRERMDKELHEAKGEIMELKNTVNQLTGLPRRVRDLEDQLSKSLQDLNLARGDLTVKTARSNRLVEDLQLAHTELDNVRYEFSRVADRNQELEQRVSELESQASPSLTRAEIDSIRGEAVREYRLSKDCLRYKENYSSGYVKYGFYLARAWLEKHREGEEFPELLYTADVRRFEFLDWIKYEPDAVPAEEHLRRAAMDNLENLIGPWEPLSSDDAPESIGALEELDGEDPPSSDP